MELIKSIVINGHQYINVRPEMDLLVKIGMTPARASAKINEFKTECAWEAVRDERNKLLNESDIAYNKALDRGNDTSVWSAYREALRDIPEQQDPLNIVWPEKPVQ